MTRVYDLDRFAERLCHHIRGRSAAMPDPVEVPTAPSRSKGSDLEVEMAWPDFNELAIELFHLQFEFNAPYRQQCLARRIRADQVQSWDQIPAMPAAAFKELELSCLAPEERTTMFFSSGTTQQRPSRHFHNADSLRVYEQSLTSWFEHQFRNGYPTQVLTLTPDATRAAHSSLVHMFETLKRDLRFSIFEFAGEVQQDGAWRVNTETAINFLRDAEASGTPVLILGTAFSYMHLLDHLRERDLRVRLAAGSELMETGGYKGRSRTLTRPELYAYITERLGVGPFNILSEYGMSELSSQAYDRIRETGGSEALDARVSPPPRRFRFPPWARTQIVSPETGREVLPGQTGLIRIFDLANVYSVLAVQTEDLAVRCDQGFQLMGRAAVAEPRGCSLMQVGEL